MNHNLIVSENAIDIIKQEASKYNDGWIPCSKQLPEKTGWYLTSRADGTVIMGHFFEDGTWRKGHGSRVIAWQPLPGKYSGKQDENIISE